MATVASKPRILRFRTRRSATRGAGKLAAALLVACGLLYTSLPISTVQAQAVAPWPAKPIHLIIPYPPGGPTDVLARIVAQELSTRLGQQVVPENKPGASGNIGAEMVAKAPPDGYTLLANASIHVITPALYPKLAYDPIADFAPISLIADVPLVLVVRTESPVKTVSDLINQARSANPPLIFGSSGNGAAQHLAGEGFKIATGVDMTHVPYKGSSPALTDLMGGHIGLMFDSMPSAMPYIRGGKLRAVAVTTSRRSASLPDVPTVIESGVANFDVSTWYGMWAPVGTPRDIVAKVSAEVAAIVRDPRVRERLIGLGAEPVGNTPEQFDAYTRSELRKWGEIVRRSGAKAD